MIIKAVIITFFPNQRKFMSHIHTHLAQATPAIEPTTRSIVPPIYPSATFARQTTDTGYEAGRVYARPENPTYLDVERLLTMMEGGFESALYASGMAACSAVLLAQKTGAQFVVPKTLYVGLSNWFLEWATHWGYGVRVYDNGDPDDLARVAGAGRTDVIWVETPSNPMMDITDIAAAAAIARGCGAILVVDNTVPTPLLTQPLRLGADFVVHSCSKALNGHHDVIAGAVIAKEDTALWQTIKKLRGTLGGILGSFEAWLLLRGLKTLHLRIAASCDNTLALALALQGHPAVEGVLYPGLPSHPGHDTARVQMHGRYGALMSVLVRGGAPAALAVIRALKIFKVATSLGGTESLIEHRATVEDYKLTTPPNLLRVSVGIEDPSDLITDVTAALDTL
jgi:cystathionine gamma-synthase